MQHIGMGFIAVFFLLCTCDPAPSISHIPAVGLNHLADQKSPYLLQLAHNPADWYPWEEVTLSRAGAEDKRRDEGTLELLIHKLNPDDRYGGRIASVVDVRNRQPNAEKFKFRGGIGLVSSRLAVEMPLTRDRKLQLLAAVRVGINDFLFGLTDRLENTRSRFSDGTAKLRWLVNDGHIVTLSGFFSQDFYQIELLSKFSSILAESNQYNYSTLNGTAEWLWVLGGQTSLVT